MATSGWQKLLSSKFDLVDLIKTASDEAVFFCNSKQNRTAINVEGTKIPMM